MKMPGLGMLLLCLFLILYGIAAVTNIQIVWMSPVTGLAALAAGVLLLIGK